jgi:hypothetical protein
MPAIFRGGEEIFLDAVQHKEVEVLEAESENVTLPTPAYPDATHQLSNVTPETERISKDVYGEGKTLLKYLQNCPAFREKILALRIENPEYLNWDEVTFRHKHRDLITLITLRVRVALWQEFELAVLNNRNIRVKQMFAGVCTEGAFYKLIENPIRLAFILLAPTDYIVTLKEAHEAGLDKLRELLSAKVVDEEGYMNPKAADMVIKAFALIDARLKGAIVQRVDQRVLTAQVAGTGHSAIQALPNDMNLLEAELEKTRKQIAQYMGKLRESPTVEELNYQSKDIVIEKNIQDVAASYGEMGYFEKVKK